MAEQKTSRLVPQHQFWEDDLPLREVQPPLGAAASLGDGAVSLSDKELALSRTDNVMRGAGLFFGSVGLLLYLFLLRFGGEIALESFDEEPVLASSLLILLVLVAPVFLFLPRLDLTLTKDQPVLLNRADRLVRAFEFKWSWNPFGRWPQVIKEFSWDNVQAEIQKQAGFNGKAYVVRYALVLCVCKPGTLEVVDRITLLGNRIVTQDLEPAWNYLRRYMEQGPAGLPAVEQRPQGHSFRRSFFEYMPWWDPTEDGRRLRADMPGWLLAFNSVVTLLMLPLFAGSGICHYIVMRVAPDPDWSNTPVVRVDAPAAVDRSAG